MSPRGPPPSPPREEASTLSAGAVGKNRLGDLSQPSATPHSAGKAGDRGEESPGAGEIQAETAQEKPAAAEVGALPGSSARKPGILCFQFNVNICRSIHSPIYHSHIHAFPRPSIPHPRVHRPFILHPSSNILDQPSSIVIHPSTHPSFFHQPSIRPSNKYLFNTCYVPKNTAMDKQTRSLMLRLEGGEVIHWSCYPINTVNWWQSLLF